VVLVIEAVVEAITPALLLEVDTRINLPIVLPLNTDTPTAAMRIQPPDQTHISLGPP